jgi:hypothetical protein
MNANPPCVRIEALGSIAQACMHFPGLTVDHDAQAATPGEWQSTDRAFKGEKRKRQENCIRQLEAQILEPNGAVRLTDMASLRCKTADFEPAELREAKPGL